MGKSVEVQNLTFHYNEKVILDRLNLKIEEGTFITIIGPNGSGKSTLLKMIATNLKPIEGVIFLGNKEILNYSAKDLAKELAVVPQDTNIQYDFTVQEIVMMGRHPHLGRFQREGSKDLKIIKEVMEWTDTWYLRERSINELSGGERQRVVIAKALAQESKVILLDEPISALDIHHQIEILELLKKLNEEKGVTIIVVLHDINLASRYSQEILLLHQGEMVTMGKPEDVITVDYLQKAYNVEMIVDRNVYTGHLQVIPLLLGKKEFKKRNTRVHIVCGGGTGKDLIQYLVEQGYCLSLGVVNIGDSDWEVGRALGLTMAEEAPFNHISEPVFDKANGLADQADVTILTSIPIGFGNIKNLSIVERQLKKDKKVYFYNQYPKNQPFDYVNGQGEKWLSKLSEEGLMSFSNWEGLIVKLGE